MKRKFRYAGELLATFSPTQPNMIVLAGAALGVGVYFFDFHIGQVRTRRRVRDALRASAPRIACYRMDERQFRTHTTFPAGGAAIRGHGPSCYGTGTVAVGVLDYYWH